MVVNAHDQTEEEELKCIAVECEDDIGSANNNSRKAQLFAIMTKVAGDVAEKAILAKCSFTVITIYGLLLIYSESTTVFKLRMDFCKRVSSIIEHNEKLQHHVAISAVFSCLLSR